MHCPTCGRTVRGKSVEHKKIMQALALADGNRVLAAKLLEMPRRTFYRRLHEYGIPLREGGSKDTLPM